MSSRQIAENSITQSKDQRSNTWGNYQKQDNIPTWVEEIRGT